MKGHRSQNVGSKSQAKNQTNLTKTKKKSSSGGSSSCRNILELLFFVFCMACAGTVGYLTGYKPTEEMCPSSGENTAIISGTTKTVKNTKICNSNPSEGSSGPVPLYKETGFTFDEIKTMWKCPHAADNSVEMTNKLFPTDMEMSKTKWKSIITVDPQAFYSKYLTQYPGDVRAQPVIVFSHNKTLENFDHMSKICTVFDIAMIPDKPGVCVAVTETYHDTAAYHMLHATKQTDGSFAIDAKTTADHILPEPNNYAAARALLVSFFEQNEIVQKAVNSIPRPRDGKPLVGVLLEDPFDIEQFENSVASALKVGVPKSKFVIFTTSKDVKYNTWKDGIRIVLLNTLADVGKVGESDVGLKMRRYFLQAW